MKRCQRCHRKLKDTETQMVGYGRVCFKKTFGTAFPAQRKQKCVVLPELKNKIQEEEIPPLCDDKYFGVSP